MHFQKLEIFGFKSFADKTQLLFEPGITAVVGPNGCGKSNVFDSIRWVLGEQSIKDLRGSSRVDVIFNGTEKKPSLGFAEVSLTFINDCRTLPIDFNEVTVTRRIFRSGESEYLINKSVVRLKDIQELFMGTGLGANAYSMVQQGKVEQIVSAKPEERRFILDEASGITKYKAKRKEALSKLTATEDNLLRINDIVTEVKRQITSVERQANKARRYKEVFDDLKIKEELLAFHFKSYYKEQFTIIKNQIDEGQRDQEELSLKHQRLTESLKACHANLHNIEKDIQVKSEDLIRIESQMDLSHKQIGFNVERMESLQSSELKSQEQKALLTERCQDYEKKIAALHEEQIQLQTKITQLQEKRAERQAVITHIQTQIDITRKASSEHREHLKQSQIELRHLERKSIEMDQSLQSFERRITEKSSQIVKLTNEMESFKSRKNQLQGEANQLSQQTLDLQQKKSEQDAKHVEWTAALTDVEQSVIEAERRKIFLVSQKEFTEKLNSQYQEIPDPVVEGRFLSAQRPQDQQSGVIGKIKDIESVSEEMLNNLEIDVKSPFYQIICETKFIELDPEQISIKIQQLEASIDKMHEQENQLKIDIDQQQELIKISQQAIIECERKQSVIQSQMESVEQRFIELNQKKQDDVTGLETLTAELENLKQQLLKNQDDMTCFQKRVKETEVLIAESDALIEKYDQEKDLVRIEVSNIDSELRSSQQEQKHHQDNQKLYQDMMLSWTNEIHKIDQETDSQLNKKDDFAEEINKLKERIEALSGDRVSLQEALEEKKQQRHAAKDDVRQLNEKISLVEVALKGRQDQAQSLQLNEQELTFKESALVERIQQSYKVDYHKIEENLFSPEQLKMLEDLEGLQALVEQLRKKCDNFGTVNFVAIEEYDELKGRFEFLTQQQSDLLEAKSHLLNTIQKINRSTHDMFMTTFEKVSQEFRNHFKVLFGGGDAQLILMDPENIFETGIDIVARPRGKKLQNISLLSGGEKTLTAVALIFGIFKVNPSPFCILDEIDAALDESNIGRFAALLKDFSARSQFIVITHNKKSMSIADVMYGVTMPETGVSKVVSVVFHKDEQPQFLEPIKV